MRITRPYPAVSSSRLPEGVTILPRKPVDTRFEEVPRVWFGHSSILSIGGSIFSFIIPEHERFFIHSVQAYMKNIKDPEQLALVKVFIKQESIHYATHDAFNQTRRHHGMDVDRDLTLIKETFEALKKRWSLKIKLGMTAFMEHCTACSAHLALGETSPQRFQHPTMQELWKWHAVEEIEHKAVAYDLFKSAGGGYFTRIFSAIITCIADAKLLKQLAKNAGDDIRAAKANGTYPTKNFSPEERAFAAEALEIARLNNRKLIRSVFKYFLPFFHPWKNDDSAFLKKAYPNYGNESTALPA